MTGRLSYDVPGATEPGSAAWARKVSGFASYERTVRIGAGDERWASVTAAVLAWAVKTRSGFAVRALDAGDETARPGVDYEVTARVGPVRIVEPVRVVAVVESATRCGFAYGTRIGHPVSGEEAFVVHRDSGGTVWFTLRSLTRPPTSAWRVAFPAVLVAQRWYRRRYLRALR